ncbi:MAG: sugar ABC transporter substrate-binding protein [Acidobacteria bacterium]|nr:MAG: sugar ABC transporter substrate-binding protein [Acidobacteriota bacterium]
MSMHRVAARFFIVTAVVGLAFAGCGRKEERAATGGSPAGKKYRFAVMPKALNLPVFFYARTGAERAAKELGNVEVIWRAPESADPLRQKEILESFITQGVDGIAISCTSADLLNDPINKAIEAGIPVVTWDSDAPRSKRIAFWGVDDLKSGQIMGEEAAKLVGGKGKVALMTSLGAENLARRLDGVKESLKKHPDMEVVETYDIKEDPTRSAEMIASGTSRYPDLAVWISVGGWPVFVRNALDPIDPAKTKFVCFDTVPPAPELLKTGKVQVLIGQKYFGWGSEPVKLLAGIKQGRMPAEKKIDSGVDVVTKDNVDAYLEQWKKWEKGE